jgi:multidrug efflux pump
VRFSRILLITGPLFGIYYTILNALQAMNAAVSSFFVNISRQGLVYLPLLFILNAAIGINGLVWAQPAADLVSIVLCAVLYAAAMRKNTRTFEVNGKCSEYN